ncbi:oligosaccharide flippase family protein [Vibrio alginolyticus]|nr:oligosaccharide flippase family protein [Vibrio alginolyticus]
MTYKTDKKTIAKNTLYLYVRQILIVLITLYSMRVVLDGLGVVDYGIYSVVAGIVALCSVLATSMASTTQRFFSFALGKSDDFELRKIFSVNLIIYFIIAAIAVLLLETIGLWFVKKHLNIPLEKYSVALTIYQYSITTLIFSILSSPFLAIIIAHEKMHYFALISIFESILKLGVAVAITYYQGDKLEYYGGLLLSVSIVVFLLYLIICSKKFNECQFREWYWDRKLFIDIISFTGWALFGQFTTVLRVQGLTILINQFFNPATAASRAIAISISTQVNAFSNAFNTGLYPSIIKNYASGNSQELYDIVFTGSKLSFFLMWMLTLPLVSGMELVLGLWLHEPPEHAVLFTQLTMIEMLIMSISLPLTAAARAPGKIKTYELILGTIQISIILVCYLFLSLGYPAYSVFIIAIVVNLIMFLVRLKLVSYLISLPILEYTKEVLIPVIKAISLPILFVSLGLDINAYFYVVCVFIITLFSIVFIGFDLSTRNKMMHLIGNKIKNKLGSD